jgi:hypothetical protein
MLWLRLGAVAVAAGACFASGYRVAVWRASAAELERQQAEARDAHRRAEIALRSAQQFEVDREHIQARLIAAQGRLAAALAIPAPQCPGVELGRIIIPGTALCGLRESAGQLDDDPDACRSRPAVPRGASAPGAGHRAD